MEAERTGLERGDGFIEGELIKHVNILMKKDAGILTVRGENNRYGTGENQTRPRIGTGPDLVYWCGPLATCAGRAELDLQG